MCVYKRVLYELCNHSRYSAKVERKCDEQKAFDKGEGAEVCKKVSSHPLATLKVAGQCPRCDGSQKTVTQKLQKAKDMISQSKKTLASTDARCRAILEDVGIDMSVSGSSSDDNDDVEKLKGEMNELDGKEGSGKDNAAAEEFLKKRKESDSAKLYM
ncbi:hypothetical protein PFICI_01314 [Pestalotiopsis fici W106-1]|uniref:Uncharacterized protein n=1 Tax=Pestalotiopsis fici (strain W106-1 / CGMCC3.15140) TaxID=1229662 RepID=W3XQE3_PESFW|nr:uncharacterized protein PFICI_01314 [Pestalotiopsis fici W106-1]ETS87486.1 hypothetical protein PFICI_01314 [Pestalotiopsis fici W106-1]